jgi:hypothetical protein
MSCRILLILLACAGCSSGGSNGNPDGASDDLAGTKPADLAGARPGDLALPPDLAQTLGPCGNCPQFSHCDVNSNTCACEPGYLVSAGACAVAPAGDPAQRPQNDVCAAWKLGRTITDPKPWKAGAMQCDPGTLSRAGIDDTLRRVDLYRWLAGLYPVTDDPTWDTNDQLCAVMEAANGMLNHTPPMNWKCWTQAAYDASSSSNLAWGPSNAADSIDMYLDDNGTPSLGHRRWVMNPPLDGVGVGFANTFSCLHVFGGGNQTPAAKWQAVPNQGFVPLPLAGFATWSFHAAGVTFGNAAITVVRVDDGMNLPVSIVQLPAGYGVDAVGFARGGWQAEAGKTYRVTVAGTGLGKVTYDVKPVNCP